MKTAEPPTQSQWESRLENLLPLFGHRNWIVVADSAYPAQSKAGIETLLADADHIAVVTKVLEAITAARHVRANVYVDGELALIDEKHAPGIVECRKQLEALLSGSRVFPLAHEEIINKLDRCAQVFRILIIKTNLTLPYTSVFFELDCGYWTADAEQMLREAVQSATKDR
jgi:L-fucose mutarotase/ribose pyranase (RbsD/FucU family)